MTFGRWLLIHSFSIFLVGLLIFGYIYRDNLQLEQAYQQLLNLDVEPATPVSELEKNQQQKVVENNVVKPSSTALEKPDTAPALADSSVSPLETKPTISEVIIEQDELLFKARRAYWDKDYETAIKSYQELIYKEKTNADYLGELGNIYYALNDFPNASRHYYQAAMVLISHNQYEKARQLVSPITAMNRELGDKLKRKLMQ